MFHDNGITLTTNQFIWLIIVLVGFILGFIILFRIYLKREKTLQLLKFELLPHPILLYKLNENDKIKELALENITLRKEVESLKTENSSERFRNIGLLFLLFLIMLINKISPTKTEEK